MDHLGHIQSGGRESGEPWARAKCSLGKDTVVFTVGDAEVERIARQVDTFVLDGDVYKVKGTVKGTEEPLFFHPDDANRFRLDLENNTSSADRIALAAAAAEEQRPKPLHAAKPPKDRLTAGILAILLGGLGIHKFYLGDIGLGVIYLLFSWTFLPLVIGIIEGIIYLTKSDEEFQRQYG